MVPSIAKLNEYRLVCRKDCFRMLSLKGPARQSIYVLGVRPLSQAQSELRFWWLQTVEIVAKVLHSIYFLDGACPTVLTSARKGPSRV